MKRKLWVSCVLILAMAISVAVPALATGLVSGGGGVREIVLGEAVQIGDSCTFKANWFEIFDKFDSYENSKDSWSDLESSGESYQYLYIDCALLNLGLTENQIPSRILTAKVLYDAKYEFEGTIYFAQKDQQQGKKKVLYAETPPLGLLEEGRIGIIISVPNIVETQNAATDLYITVLGEEFMIPLR